MMTCAPPSGGMTPEPSCRHSGCTAPHHVLGDVLAQHSSAAVNSASTGMQPRYVKLLRAINSTNAIHGQEDAHALVFASTLCCTQSVTSPCHSNARTPNITTIDTCELTATHQLEAALQLGRLVHPALSKCLRAQICHLQSSVPARAPGGRTNGSSQIPKDDNNNQPMKSSDGASG